MTRIILAVLTIVSLSSSPLGAGETLKLKQERDGGPVVNLSDTEFRELGDPLFNLVLKEHADVVSLSGIQDLLQPTKSDRNLFVVHEQIMDSSRSGLRRSVITFQGSNGGEILNTNVMLSVFFSAEGFPESPTSAGAERLSALEAWAWDNHRGRYNYYKLDRSGTPNVGMTWKFRGSSNDLRQPTTFDRRETCMKCHINGGPIMKELFLPWNNWHSLKSVPKYLLRTTPANQRWPVANSDPFKQLTGAEALQKSIIAAIQQFNTSRIDAALKREAATGHIETNVNGMQTVMKGRRLLRHLFETTEFNIISAVELSGAHPIGPLPGVSGEFRIPASFFLNSNLIGGGGPAGYKGLGLASARGFSERAEASLKLSEYKSAVTRLGLRILGGAGDANFAWFVPEASHIDNDTVDRLIDRGIVPGQFVAAALAIDLRNPVLSDDRATLLRYIPSQFSFKPIQSDKRMDFALFQEHELTKSVIAAIEADNPDAGSSAREFLELLKVGNATNAPIRVLKRKIANYINGVKTALDPGNVDARKQSIDDLLTKADRLRKKVLAHEVLGELDETGGFGLFPLK